MKKLLLVLSLALLLAACSDNGSGTDPNPNVQYPLVRGDYTQTDATHAEFTGGGYKKASTAYTSAIDSTEVTDPVGFGLKFERDTTYYANEASIKFTYADYVSQLKNNLNFYKGTEVKWVNPDENIQIELKRIRGNLGGDIAFDGVIRYPCGTYTEDFRDIRVIYYTGESVPERYPYKVITFKTDSLPATLNGMRDCPK